MISISKADPSHNLGITAAINLAKSENADRSVQDALKALFSTASTAGIVQNGHIEHLIAEITLKARVGAACMAVTIKNQVPQLFADVWNMNPQQPEKCISGLLIIGQYGKVVDLSNDQRLIPTVQKFIDHPQADVRLAASIALGNATVGNPGALLDQVFQLINQSSDNKYLFLNTLREIILDDPKCLDVHFESVVELFLAHSSHQDENIRNIVAESLGRLTPSYEEQIYETLENALGSSETLKKSTIAKSIKYSGPRVKEVVIFETLVQALYRQAEESDHEVKRNALEALTSIVHSSSKKFKSQQRVHI